MGTDTLSVPLSSRGVCVPSLRKRIVSWCLWSNLMFKILVSPGWPLRDIQRWSALIQNTFRSVSALLINWKSLSSSDFLWNSVEQSWFLNNSEWQFLVTFHIFQNFSKYFNFRHITLAFSPVYEKKWATEIYFSNFVQAKDITQTWIFGFTVTAQVTKQIWLSFSETFLRV